MTSRVRHAQKEGVDVGDISAGLAYSVVRNAIQKVIRVSNPEHLGKKIVVQGGTFANDAVLRAFEKYYGVEVIRPFGSETMGAYGAALLARERAIPGVYSKLLNLQQVQSLVFQQTDRVCELCPNACHLTVTSFSDSDGEQRSFSVGNKCMRGSEDTGHEKLSNMFDLKLKLLFGRKSIPREQASRGEIGLIRALGVYEIYPFLLEFFNVLGYHVLLSDPSSEELYASGIEVIRSESMCFPGKLVFGHAQNLIDKGVKTIFAPYILGLRADNDSCPVLASYPLALLINIAGISDGDVDLISPVLSGLFVEDNQRSRLSLVCRMP